MAETSFDQGLTPGTRVQVRNRFDRGWASGFLVVDVQRDGGPDIPAYHVRRRSDGYVVPELFTASELRPEF